jgi:hypothetical protein
VNSRSLCQWAYRAGTPVPESGPRDHTIPARARDLSIMTPDFFVSRMDVIEASREP